MQDNEADNAASPLKSCGACHALLLKIRWPERDKIEWHHPRFQKKTDFLRFAPDFSFDIDRQPKPLCLIQSSVELPT
jgi:hypothetical protein